MPTLIPIATSPGQYVRRVTGSCNIPLNTLGIAEADRIAKLTAGLWNSITTGPMDRTLEIARRIHQTNPQATFTVDPLLKPWYLACHEDKPSEQERPKINRYILNEPNKSPPGISRVSKQPGQSFSSAAHDIIKQLQQEIAAWEPGQFPGQPYRTVANWQSWTPI